MPDDPVLSSDPVRRIRFGTNYHLDTWRPWTFRRDTDGEFEAMTRFGLDAVRIVGDLVRPAEDYSGSIADDAALRDAIHRCGRLGLKVLALSWNLIPDRVAIDHPMVGADGARYPRGEWGLFNLWDPDVRQVAMAVARSTAHIMAGAPGVIDFFQPTNEWTLLAYPPFGWDWRWYAGESYRAPNILVSYDRHAAAAWQAFLARLPDAWSGKILQEQRQVALADVPPLTNATNGVFSPTYTAWCRFTSEAIAGFMAELYEATKPVAGSVRILSQSVMPYPILMSGFPASGLGHQVDYWMDAGKAFDLLAVNTYGNYADFPEHPHFWDGDLPVQAWYTFFRELARMHDIPGLITSECGATSFHHSEDAQRYILLRELLQAAAFGRPEAVFELLWNDDPYFEPTHEQFFGIVRSRHELPKPAYNDARLVRRTIGRVTPQWSTLEDAAPFGYVVLSRTAMDCGMATGPLDPLTAREADLRVVTDHLLERGRPDPAHRAVIVADSAIVSSIGLIEALIQSDRLIVVPATIGQFGLDDDEQREAAALRLLGLAHRDFARAAQVCVLWHDAPPGTSSYQFAGALDLVRIDAEDLPPGALAIATFDDGTIAAYRHGNRIVSAFGLGAEGQVDAERTRYVRSLTRSVVVESGITRPVRAAQLDDPVLVFSLGDGIVAAVNSTDVDRTVEINAGASLIELPVGARRFSAFDYHRRRFVVVSAAGTLSIDGEEILVSPSGAYVVFEEGRVEVRPFPSDNGGMARRATASGHPMTYAYDEASGYFASEASLPLHVSYESPTTVECVADLETTVRLTSDGPVARCRYEERAQPDGLVLAWDVLPPGTTQLRVEYGWSERLGRPQHQEHALAVSSASVALALPAIDLAPPASVRVSVSALAADGQQLPAPGMDLVRRYRGRVIPSMAYPVDGATIVRVVHPLTYEGATIRRVEARVQTSHGWQPLTLNIGGPGQHARHLEGSEEWQEVAT